MSRLIPSSQASHRGPSTLSHPHRTIHPVMAEWKRRVAEGKLREDPNQLMAVQKLDKLAADLKTYKVGDSGGGGPNWLSWGSTANTVDHRAPKGIYLYGDVGSGKTMLMDLFVDVVYSTTPSLAGAGQKRNNRVHFNSFMLDFHNKIHEWRQNPATRKLGQDSAVESLVGDIINESPLLCFDEFQVTNIADAMLLGRLFNTLWSKGAILVATSNRPPDHLYKGGLQRESFLPFIEKLKTKCLIHSLDSTCDYRLLNEKIQDIYYIGPNPKEHLDNVWNRLTESREGAPITLSLMGRTLTIPLHLRGLGRCTFSSICNEPLGPADFRKIAESFHTLIIDDIPKLGPGLARADEARRFITLVDELYNRKVKLICSAEVPPEEIFPRQVNEQSGSGLAVRGEEEAFAFGRVVSRLHEMQSKAYLETKHITD